MPTRLACAAKIAKGPVPLVTNPRARRAVDVRVMPTALQHIIEPTNELPPCHRQHPGVSLELIGRALPAYDFILMRASMVPSYRRPVTMCNAKSAARVQNNRK